MKVIHVARKPLAGTVAQTALKYGTGGLNIDRSRIGTSESLDGGAYAKNPSPRPNPEEWRFKRGGARSKLPGDEREGSSAGMYQQGSQVEGEFQQPAGRWPANLILEHKPDCKKVGTRKVEGYAINRWDEGAHPFGGAGGQSKGYTTVEAPSFEDIYECVPDCPCVMLDEQSGERRSAGHYPSDSRGTGKGLFGELPQGQLYDDEGGASRFFKQVGGRPIGDPK